MRSLQLIIAISIILLLVTETCLLGAGDPQGEIMFSEKSFNFGIIVEGEKIDHLFKLKNVGGKILVINAVRSGCCAEITLSKSMLLPEEEAELMVTIYSEGKEGFFLETIYIHTDSSKTPFDYLRIFGIILKKN